MCQLPAILVEALTRKCLCLPLNRLFLPVDSSPIRRCPVVQHLRARALVAVVVVAPCCPRPARNSRAPLRSARSKPARIPPAQQPPSSPSSYAFVEFRSQRDAEDAYYDMYVTATRFGVPRPPLHTFSSRHGRYFEGSRLSIQVRTFFAICTAVSLTLISFVNSGPRTLPLRSGGSTAGRPLRAGTVIVLAAPAAGVKRTETLTVIVRGTVSETVTGTGTVMTGTRIVRRGGAGAGAPSAGGARVQSAAARRIPRTGRSGRGRLRLRMLKIQRRRRRMSRKNAPRLLPVISELSSCFLLETSRLSIRSLRPCKSALMPGLNARSFASDSL